MMRFYCDVHRKRDDSGYRITYTMDGENFRYTDSPLEIPVGPGDQLFVDTIPIIQTDGFIELLRRGVEVYYLRRPTLIEEMRRRLGIPKSGRGDVKVLMHIEDKWFRRVSEDFLVMRRKVSVFRCMDRINRRLGKQVRAASQTEQEGLRRLLRQVEEEKEILAKMISDEAGERYPIFKEITEELGITGDNHVLAREALAELLTYVDFSKSFVRVQGYLRLYRRRLYDMRYGHEARKALERLTMSIIARNNPRAREQEDVLMRIWLTIRGETQRPAGIEAQQ
ncbi:hypothetical protein HRbin02_00838 [Candidatus Calditenuaceae archaeon HR02]|nr:hypothetical protein HRbin02_00838 [Candidatus Calditenuaceae archaeon HR02]